MKLLRQTKLHFAQGASDKVYEVELCEASAGNFVVNFRYGRRGTNLRDGTKTIVPVGEAKAIEIFDALVATKTAKGYQIVAQTADRATIEVRPDAASEVVRPGHSKDARARAIVTQLEAGGSDGWSLSRVVWRAGELRLLEALDSILKHFRPGIEAPLTYCIVWAVGRIASELPRGDPRVGRVLTLLDAQRGDGVAKDSRAEALRWLAIDGRLAVAVAHDEGLARRERQTLAEMLPAAIAPLASDEKEDLGGVAEAERAFRRLCKEQPGTAANAALLLYASRSLRGRSMVVHALRSLAIVGSARGAFRRMLKLAEFRADGRIFGEVLRRYERTRRTGAETISGGTARYMRRRGWRTLRRLGDLEHDDYTEMAAGVLRAMGDDDAEPVQRVESWDYRAGEERIRYRDGFSRAWAFSQILFGNSRRHVVAARKLRFELAEAHPPEKPPPSSREERFPELWDRKPGRVLGLLAESECAPVHHFGVLCLRGREDYLTTLKTADIAVLLLRPYEETATLGLELAVRRFDPSQPDWHLAIAAANSPLQRARQQAVTWLTGGWLAILGRSDVLAALITSPRAETQDFVAERLSSGPPAAEVGREVVARVLAELMDSGGRTREWARRVGEVLQAHFGSALRELSWEVLEDLASHSSAPVQELAAAILSKHPRFAQDPPEALLKALLTSRHASVRARALELIGLLPDAKLAERAELIASFATHEVAEMRAAARPIVARLAAISWQQSTTLAMAIIQILCRQDLEKDRANDLVALLRTELSPIQNQLPTPERFRLVGAATTVAQELGAEFLSRLSPKEITIDQALELGSHDVLRAREVCWDLFRDDVSRIRAELRKAVRLLDAKWEDTRRFAAEYFREHFKDGDFRPEVVVAICDSTRDEVQRFGQELVMRNFARESGTLYVTRLAEHPSVTMQQFVSSLVLEHAAGDPQRIRTLAPFFASVLARVNQGRVAKARTWHFFREQIQSSQAAASIIAEIVTKSSATMAVGDKMQAISVLTAIAQLHPSVSQLLELKPVQVRNAL